MQTSAILPSKLEDPNREDRLGFTPLLWAVQNGDVTKVKSLLNANADVNARYKEFQIREMALILHTTYSYTIVETVMVKLHFISQSIRDTSRLSRYFSTTSPQYALKSLNWS